MVAPTSSDTQQQGPAGGDGEGNRKRIVAHMAGEEVEVYNLGELAQVELHVVTLPPEHPGRDLLMRMLATVYFFKQAAQNMAADWDRGKAAIAEAVARAEAIEARYEQDKADALASAAQAQTEAPEQLPFTLRVNGLPAGSPVRIATAWPEKASSLEFLKNVEMHLTVPDVPLITKEWIGGQGKKKGKGKKRKHNK